MQKSLTRPVLLFSLALAAACAGAPRISPMQTVSRAPESTPAPTLTATLQLPTQIVPAAQWIEVDLARQSVILHAGGAVTAEYPVSSGVTSDPQYATPTGVYRVQSMDKGPVESVPGVYVSDVIMFDIMKGNGFHSRPMDADGRILDPTLGKPATAGCVRVGESAKLFEFARPGMWVWIH